MIKLHFTDIFVEVGTLILLYLVRFHCTNKY